MFGSPGNAGVKTVMFLSLFQVMWGRCCPGDGDPRVLPGHQAQECGASRTGNGAGEVIALPPMALLVMCWFLSILASPLIGPVVSRQGGVGWAEGVRFGAGWCLLSPSESGSNSSLLSTSVHLFTLLRGWGVLYPL